MEELFTEYSRDDGPQRLPSWARIHKIHRNVQEKFKYPNLSIHQSVHQGRIFYSCYYYSIGEKISTFFWSILGARDLCLKTSFTLEDCYLGPRSSTQDSGTDPAGTITSHWGPRKRVYYGRGEKWD